MTSTGTVRLEVDEDSGGKVATLVLDDPTRRNAMGRAMYATIPDLVAEVVYERVDNGRFRHSARFQHPVLVLRVGRT